MKAKDSTLTETETQATEAQAPRRKKVFLVVRLIDYRLQALTPEDPEYPEGQQEWADLGPDTTISVDREAMYQLARGHAGLLLAAEGLPTPGRISRLTERVKSLADGTSAF